MNVTLQDLLHAINIIGEDLDVCVDGIDSIAVCPPVRLTPAGRTYFRAALAANVVVEYGDYGHRATYVSDDDELADKDAWELLASLAGYCADSKTKTWFEGENAELI